MLIDLVSNLERTHGMACLHSIMSGAPARNIQRLGDWKDRDWKHVKVYLFRCMVVDVSYWLTP